MNGHSIIPPSSAHIWGAPEGCTGWVLMSQQYPETEETPESKEGTASHEIGSRLIINQSTGNISNYAKDFVGETASNGVIYTEDMFEAATEYTDDVGDIMRTVAVFGGENFGNEHRVEAKRINDHSFGTIDQFIFNHKTGDLYLWDYKFGFEVVEVFENWQLINYASGILDQLGLDGLKLEHINVHFRIVQPRAHHRDGTIREWIIKAIDLRAYFNILEMNAAESLGSNATIRSGSHCRHCSARHACPAALQAGIRMYEVAMQPVPVDLSPEALGVQLTIVKRALKQLDCLVSGFEEQAKSLIRSGSNINGWMVEQGVGREKWNKPVAEVIAMGNIFEKNLKKPDEAITPKQAVKLGIDAAVIKEYSITPNTGLKIVPDNGNKARSTFGAIKP